ncbi:FkbM family methyltransferase [Sphingomonas crusticola]|uniref:FkbM family methyltransferase n=1 Tax=Sphingomonas crusticola TaxID=1697973 RepID=UPI000E2384D9|nr:FkbM family methyltransferase [Sphingomonas crusticola]
MTHPVAQLIWKQRTRFARRFDILGLPIDLPAGHLLDWHIYRNRRFDLPVAEISELIARKYEQPTMIDIGANVGDTAAFMLRRPDIAVLCIEGNDAFLPWLERNIARISKGSEIVAAYVGFGNQVKGAVRTIHGTASFVEGSQAIETLPLSEIIASKPRFGKSRLLKTDTDGFDPKIIMAAKDVIAEMRPILHIEYTPVGSPEVAREHSELVKTLTEIGYKRFHFYDNFGNHMIRLKTEDLGNLDSLHAYVQSARKDKRTSVFYYDLVAMTDDDTDISDSLISHYNEGRPILPS